MAMFRKLSSKLRRLRRDKSGAASVEFVLVAPVYLAIMFSMFEAGWLMTQSMMLERALDITVRDLRLGVQTDVSHDNFKTIICDNASIIKDCEANVLLEMVPINSAADVPTTTICRDRSSNVDPVVSFSTGARSEIMYLRACVVIDPLIPGMGLGLHLPLDETGGFALVSYSAFVNEPG